MRTLKPAADAWQRLRAVLERRRNKRVLIHEILSIQVLITAAIGGIAVASLYWGGQWVLQDNYSRWALQWTEELNELGAPLYLSDDYEAMLRLESYIDKYPEISHVTYFDATGEVRFAIGDSSGEAQKRLTPAMLERVAEVIGTSTPYVVETSFLTPRQFDVVAPVWTESIADDGLFAFDPSSGDAAGNVELIGFVGLHLDFVIFHDRLVENIKTAILVLLTILVISTLYGRRALRKALKSISDLQRPLQELAKGNLTVEFEPAEHREISEIVEALETTASALNERDARLLELANHDPLTGLFNRRRFVEELRKELDRVLDGGFHSALLFIDLDQFKYINDTCGHPAGDRLIAKVAAELKRTVGSRGLVARFGGDEFAVLVSRTTRTAIEVLGNRVIADMRRLAHIEGDRVFHVHCSIGITMVTGGEINHDELIAQADIACREAKAAGRNRLAFYDASDWEVERLTTDAGWMTRLREAIDHDLFELRFQPINCIATGATSHHEVLLRLRGEDGRLVSPDAFLPAAVRFGLMAEIDAWMVRHAAAAFAVHRQNNPPLRLSVNLSANAFESGNLARTVAASFREFGVPADHVIFEITESVAVRQLHNAEQQTAALRELGCGIALDDFGTGYSSFTYLQRLKVDYIKIDGSFVINLVDNPMDQKVIRLIAEIARESDMKTIAEYVQTAEALSLLAELGVDLAQGFYIGRPTKRPTLKTMPISLDSKRRERQQTEKFRP